MQGALTRSLLDSWLGVPRVMSARPLPVATRNDERLCRLMSQPNRHHYLPVFYLKRWAGACGRVWRYYRPHDGVVALEVGPAFTGFTKRGFTGWTALQARR